MSGYRLKKVVTGYGEYYILQKRLLGFLWWYNPDNIDGMITGVYFTRNEALEEYEKKMTKRKVTFEVLEAKHNSIGEDDE